MRKIVLLGVLAAVLCATPVNAGMQFTTDDAVNFALSAALGAGADAAIAIGDRADRRDNMSPAQRILCAAMIGTSPVLVTELFSQDGADWRNVGFAAAGALAGAAGADLLLGATPYIGYRQDGAATVGITGGW